MVRDDDFDRRASRQTELDVAVDRARVAARETLAEAERKRQSTTSTDSRKQTPARGLGAWTQGLAVARDPVAETELQVRKAREVIAKLIASQPQQKKQLESELSTYLESATDSAALAASRPNGREIAATVLEVIAEAQSYLTSALAAGKPADAAGSDAIAVAQRGAAGAGGRLPHFDVVQRAFGAHDLSGVRAHVGGAAADASRELGAQAYTHGDHIAFASEPTVQLVAHEATHIVQQRAGVSLKGIDSGASDVHEQQANAVEHAVAQGQPVESMLSSFVGVGSGSATTHAVQRKGDKSDDAPLAHDKFSAKMDYELFEAENVGTNLNAPAFVHRHIAELRRDIDVYLVSRDPTTGVPDVTFTPDIGPFMTALFAGFDQDDNAAKVSRLRSWVAPADLYEIVDRNRAIFEVDKTKHAWSGDPNEGLNYAQGRKGPPQYANAVAVGIGAALEERLLTSLTRVSQQLVVATARHRASGKDTPVAASELVPAHPLDWQVALAMVGRGTPTVHVADGAAPTTSTAHVAYRKVKQVEWQGALGGPWNAVRVDPPEAGPEAVAAELLGDSTEAYRIQRVGPYFLIPEDQAARFPQAVLFHRAGQHDAVSDLAHGKNAATVERTEAERGLPANAKVPTSAELMKQWQSVHDQLIGISAVVRPYALDAELGLALSRHAVHAVDLASLSGHDAAVRAQLFTKQANLLDRVAAQVAALTASAPTPKPGPSSKALHDVLEKLVRVANLSHLPETGEAALAEVVVAQRAAMPDALEAALGDIATQIEIAREVGGQARQAQHRSEGTYGASLAERANVLRQRVAVFRSNMLRDKADATELEALGRDVEALRFEAGVIAEVGQLGQLFEILDQLEESNWVVLSEGVTSKIGDTSDDNRIGRLETARRGSMDLRRELNIIHGDWLDVEKTAQSMEANLAKGGVKDADAKARALVQPRIAAIQAKLKKLGGEEAVQAFLKDAYDKIDSAQTRALIVQIATMIGVAALASATGGLAGGVAEGLGAGSLGVSMVSLTAETAMFTAVSARLSGEPMLAAFVNNGIGNLLTFGAMRGVGKALEATESVGWTLKMAKAGAKVRTAALAIAKTGELTAQVLVAQGIQIAQAEYESVRATGHVMSTHELEMTAAQGMAMMIGTAISHRVLGDPSLGAHTLGSEIGARITKLRAMSDAVGGGGDAGQAVALMEQTRKLIEDIGNRARELGGKNDHELASLGYTRQQVEALAKFAGTQSKALAAMDAGSFAAQLGLHTVVPGRVFSGGAHEIDAVTSDFRSRGYVVEKTGEGFRVAKKDEPPIELFVRPDENRSERGDTKYGDGDGSVHAFAGSKISGTLDLKGDGSPEHVARQIGQYIATQLNIDPASVAVKPLQGGRSGAGVFRVRIGGHDLGIFKIFGDTSSVDNEVKMMKLLHSKNMQIYDVVGEMGQVQISTGDGPRGGLLMETAQGTSIEGEIKQLPPIGDPAHQAAVASLEAKLNLVARGMAEMHAAFASGSAESEAQKRTEAQYIASKFTRLSGKMNPADHQAIASKLDAEIIPAFMKSPVPATAYHGDANAGNFLVDSDLRLHVIDVGTMKYSLDSDGKGNDTGAADLGRFMQSVQVAGEGRLSPRDVTRIQHAFLAEYFAATRLSPADFDAGIKLFRIELEMAVINHATTEDEINRSLGRVGSLLGIAITGTRTQP